MDSLGLVIKNESGDWCSSDSTDKHATPYEAAAALLPTNSTIAADAGIPEIEVDSVIDADFGIMYRVWHGISLIGTFYHAADDKWVAQPCNNAAAFGGNLPPKTCLDQRPRCNTAASAQLLIVRQLLGGIFPPKRALAVAGLLVAGTADEAVSLLDKPFDELTVAEWQALKLAAQQAEFVAA